MPLILATQEAEIESIASPSKPRQKVHETPSQTMAGFSDVSLSSYLFREAKIGGSWSRPSWA
jgi:hypothetical protein